MFSLSAAVFNPAAFHSSLGTSDTRNILSFAFSMSNLFRGDLHVRRRKYGPMYRRVFFIVFAGLTGSGGSELNTGQVYVGDGLEYFQFFDLDLLLFTPFVGISTTRSEPPCAADMIHDAGSDRALLAKILLLDLSIYITVSALNKRCELGNQSQQLLRCFLTLF